METRARSSAGEGDISHALRRAAQEYRKNVIVNFGFQLPLIQEIESKTSICLSNIGDDELAILGTVLGQRPFPNLTSLRIVDCSLEKRVGVVKLCRALASGNLSTLETLGVTNSCINDKDLLALSGALGSGHCSSLKHLSLGGDRDEFETGGASALAEVLASSEALPVLEELSVRGVEEEEGMVAIFGALEDRKMQPGLTSLDFQKCNIRLGAASILARALQYCRHLRGLVKLDLTGCRTMGDEEVGVLCEAFKSKNLQHLFCLSIANTSMAEKGFLEIASLLKAGCLPGLHYFHAIDCVMTETSAKALIEAYQINVSLVVDMVVDWPGFSYQSSAQSLMLRNETSLEQRQSGKDLNDGGGGGGVSAGVDTGLVEIDEQKLRRSPSSVVFIIKKFRISRWKITKVLFSIKKVLGKRKTRILLRFASLRSQKVVSDRESVPSSGPLS